jgi:hypothetical protein
MTEWLHGHPCISFGISVSISTETVFRDDLDFNGIVQSSLSSYNRKGA